MEANAKVTDNSTLGDFQSLSSGKDSYCVILATMVYSPSLLPLHNVVLCSVEHFQSRCCVCKGGEIGQTFGLIISDQVWSDHIGPSSCVIGEFQVFGWTDSTITLFTLWGTLDFPLFFFPSALLLKKSLRLSVVKKIYSCHYLVRSLGPFVWLWGRPFDVYLFSFQP